jgi:diaminopimelate decarboxylase
VEKQYTVVGNVCEIDNFAINRTINEVNEKDIIAIKTAGAYGYSMASNYNSRFRPAEILIKNNTAHLIRKRDSFEDLIKNQIVIK